MNLCFFGFFFHFVFSNSSQTLWCFQSLFAGPVAVHAGNFLQQRKLKSVEKQKSYKRKNKKQYVFLFFVFLFFVFFILFFLITPEPFGVFDRSLLQAVAALILRLSRPKTLKSVEKQKSYGKKTKFYGLGTFLQVSADTSEKKKRSPKKFCFLA